MRARSSCAGLLCALVLAGCGARSGLLAPTDLEDAETDAVDAARDVAPDEASVDEGADVTDDDASAPDVADEEASIDVVDVVDVVEDEAGIDVVEEPVLVDVRPELTVAVPVCNQLTTAGNRTPATNEINLGRTAGSFLFEYDARTAPDTFIVSYEGNVLFNSGCIRGTGTARLMYAGRSRNVSIEVQPNCEGRANTSWTFTAHCPD